MYPYTLIVLIICCLPATGSTQFILQPNAILSSGGAIENDQHIWQHSLGESVIFSTENKSGLQLSQGVQQPGDMITSVEVIPESWSVELYPNPTPGELLLDYHLPQAMELTTELFAANGQLLQVGRIEGQSGQQLFDLSTLPAGNYWLWLRAQSEGKQTAAFQIIKQ